MIRLTRPARTTTARASLAAIAIAVLGCAASAAGPPRPDGAVEAAEAVPTPGSVVAPPRETATPATADTVVELPPPVLPAPRPAAVAPLGMAIDFYQPGDFASQSTKDFCVPGALATMMNVIDRERVLPHPPQEDLNRIARRLSTDRLVGAGSEPEGWAGTLNELGYGPYEARSVRTREAAIVMAAEAIRDTGRPVGLLVWRGAHAWVMSGFEGMQDPADGSVDVTAVLVQDPWYPRVSSIWGPGQTPNTRIAVRDLAADYLPWKRPTARYPEKDGQFVLVLPVVEDPPPEPPPFEPPTGRS